MHWPRRILPILTDRSMLRVAASTLLSYARQILMFVIFANQQDLFHSREELETALQMYVAQIADRYLRACVSDTGSSMRSAGGVSVVPCAQGYVILNTTTLRWLY